MSIDSKESFDEAFGVTIFPTSYVYRLETRLQSGKRALKSVSKELADCQDDLSIIFKQLDEKEAKHDKHIENKNRAYQVGVGRLRQEMSDHSVALREEYEQEKRRMVAIHNKEINNLLDLIENGEILPR